MDRILIEENKKYTAEANKELSFKLNNILQQIELIKMRLDLSQKEMPHTTNKTSLEEYIKELKDELEHCNSEKYKIESSLNEQEVSAEDIDIVKDKIRNFLLRIFDSTPDIQNSLIKDFVDSITYNINTESFGIHLVIKISSKETTIINKYIYSTF